MPAILDNLWYPSCVSTLGHIQLLCSLSASFKYGNIVYELYFINKYVHSITIVYRLLNQQQDEFLSDWCSVCATTMKCVIQLRETGCSSDIFPMNKKKVMLWKIISVLIVKYNILQVDPNTGVAMYESDDIIKYLADTYGVYWTYFRSVYLCLAGLFPLASFHLCLFFRWWNGSNHAVAWSANSK